ncbi:carnitine O-acetyltransferase [Martiniozyma asiatica (nom. inval.)]|nr:carnitine O-acetyltransferase [Martiniozyma asiatica]
MTRMALSTQQLQVQKGPLYSNQEKIPPLPVPKLSETLELYKSSVAPLYPNGINDANFKRYAETIDSFGNSNEGKNLQERLEQFSIGKRNWLAEFWDNYAYLDYRDPVSPFVSYFFSHKDVNTLTGKDQILKATLITKFIVEYAGLVEREQLEPEMRKGQPFCMESFKWMFNNIRVPGDGRDGNVVFKPEEGRFAVVSSNGRLWKLLTHDEYGKPLGLGGLYAGISAILKMSNELGKTNSPVGILTSSNRDDWFKNYQELKKNPINCITLEEIGKSIFVLCLDDVSPLTIEGKSRNCWHGSGWNRWFDKPIQMFVTKNGSSGFLGEHSKMDGTPTLAMNDWLVKKISGISLDKITEEMQNDNSIADIEELKFEITPPIQNAIESELVKFNNVVNKLDIKVWQFYGIGKKDIKLFKLSPDGFIQMLIQLAYFKITKTLRPTYESASTRAYFGGRTETCRSVTLETRDFVENWEDVNVPMSEKVASFRAAVAAHGAYIKRASNGYGVDRHLFGLNQMIQQGEDKPKIFSDPMFGYSQKWYLSTSQLSSEEFNGYGWSPVIPEGFGLAYMVNNDWLHVNITAYKSNVLGLKVEDMFASLEQSAKELKEGLLSEMKEKPKL